ncbi:MAG: hypothetical protein NWS83_02865 [Burkholderiaceae bacterium]|nr:hypothetical protein [Burkholderiaceae bacterium]
MASTVALAFKKAQQKRRRKSKKQKVKSTKHKAQSTKHKKATQQHMTCLAWWLLYAPRVALGGAALTSSA